MNPKYEKNLNLPHHISIKHPQMSLYARSAQFAPFSALTGYDDAVIETARVTGEKIELDDEVKNELDRKLTLLLNKIDKRLKITFTYFIPDKRKAGGEYETIIGVVKKFDDYNRKIILEDETEIKLNEIIDITISDYK